MALTVNHSNKRYSNHDDAYSSSQVVDFSVFRRKNSEIQF